jgi:hypothetical protein
LLCINYRDGAYKYQEVAGIQSYEDPDIIAKSWLTTDRKVAPPHIFNEVGEPSDDIGSEGPYLLRWQTSPLLLSSQINVDTFQEKGSEYATQKCIETGSAVLSGFLTSAPGPPSHELRDTALFATLLSMNAGRAVNYLGDPMAFFVLPVFDSFDISTRKVVGVLKAALHWKSYLQSLLPANVNNIIVVLENKCDGSYTYEINGSDAYAVGPGDLHDRAFDSMEETSGVTLTVLEDGTATGVPLDQGDCPYSIHVYPSRKFHDRIVTKAPMLVTFCVGSVFLFAILLFIYYDRLVERRQRLILAKATQSTAIVSVRSTMQYE